MSVASKSITYATAPALPRVEKPALVRCLGPVDVEALRATVGRLSEEVWRQEDAAKENDYFCFAHTRHIVFRFIEPQLDAAVLLLESDMDGLAAAAAAGDGAGSGTLWLRRAGLPQGDAGQACGRGTGSTST